MKRCLIVCTPTVLIFKCACLNLTEKLIFILFVSDFPAEGPSIETSRKQYQVGETAHLICTAQRSSPATELSWYINGEPVSLDCRFYIDENLNYLFGYTGGHVSTYASS